MWDRNAVWLATQLFLRHLVRFPTELFQISVFFRDGRAHNWREMICELAEAAVWVRSGHNSDSGVRVQSQGSRLNMEPFNYVLAGTGVLCSKVVWEGR